ncbi:hypothetical protein COV18_04785 [Candidatus Woesearchaeota archaeon CG10_big_fil_rev_8_21_14_0_10_37_12]|nr:MAG: hypothetical protein COV18_04785 [Candidatus Woesearchaeota archaeon CG10_big_fil_rev_8_21_14_0_10_37_12]
MVRHVHTSIFLIVAIVGVAAILFSSALYPSPVLFAVSYLPGEDEVGSDTVIVSLNVNDFISSELEAVGSGQFSGLNSGTIQTRDSRTEYTQSLRFAQSGVFSGGQVLFGRDESNRVSDFLQFDGSGYVFEYRVDFGSGLRSKVEVAGRLEDMIGEEWTMGGARFALVDAVADTTVNRMRLRFFGGFGSVDFEDNDYTDDLFQQSGVRVNGQTVDADVKIRATETSNDKLTIFSIQYRLSANAKQGGDVQVLPLHCVREFLQHPLGMLFPDFDICYKGASGTAQASSGISGNLVHVKARGDDEYVMRAQNLYGQTYEIPLAQLPGMYGNRGRNFVFVEAANLGAPNINVNDYLLVNSRDWLGVSHVLRLDQITTNQVYFEDLGGNQRQAVFDSATGEGDLIMSEGTYHFRVTGNQLAIDQNNDNTVNGGEAAFHLPGGTYIDFGPGFTVSIITPQRLLEEQVTDEVTQFDITFGSNIDLDVSSPQGTVFELHGSGSGVREGMTLYGIHFRWDQESDSDDLRITVPGARARQVRGGATAQVYLTLERDRWMTPAQQQSPAAVCGNRLKENGEYCDPPGSLCAQNEQGGVCADDCKSCAITPPAVCGNRLLERGEQCESRGDCAQTEDCQNCNCVPLPKAVCGNNLLDLGEQCEKDVDCLGGLVCRGCMCVPQPRLDVQTPTAPVAAQPVQQPNVIAKFFLWIAGLFGA